MRTVSTFGLLLAALFMAFGIATAGWLVGAGVTKARLGDRYVTVKGLAERDVEADLALWPIRFVATGNDLASVQAQVQQNSDTITAFLKGQGFGDGEISVESPQVTDLYAQAYRSGPVENRFIISGLVMLRTPNVAGVAKANREAASLIGQGVVLSSDQGPSRPSYLFTKIAEVKPAMIEEATKRARESAQKFAEESGSRLAGIRFANQGLFEIMARDSAPGVSESEQIAKTVRVVTTIDYFLAE